MILDRFNSHREGRPINAFLIHRPGDLSGRAGQTKNKLSVCACSSHVGEKLQGNICSIQVRKDQNIRGLLKLGIRNFNFRCKRIKCRVCLQLSIDFYLFRVNLLTSYFCRDTNLAS